MDQNYNWNNPSFKSRCGESLNLAVNLIADVLHTFYVREVIEFPSNLVLILFIIISIPIFIYARKTVPRKRRYNTTINSDNKAATNLHLKAGFNVKDWKITDYRLRKE